MAHLFLQHVEVVDDDTNEQVEGEEGTKHDEDDEEQIVVERVLAAGLLINVPAVHGILHHLHPALKRRLQYHVIN